MAKIATSQSKSSTKKSTTSVICQDEQAQITELAYQFFVERGCEHGHDTEDWARAVAIIKKKKK